MQITELVWKLFLLLLPGVVSAIMIRYITTNKQYSIFNFIIYSAVLGIGTLIIMEMFCSIYWAIYSFFSSPVNSEFGLNLEIWDNLFNNEKFINKNEVFISYLLAIPLGFFWGVLITKKKLIKLFQKWNLTKRYGDSDVWSFYLNSPDTEWIYLHSRNENKTYFGKIRAYSDSSENREILLEDVIVYTSDTWEEEYQSNAVYLELNNRDFSIETPKPKENDTNSDN